MKTMMITLAALMLTAGNLFADGEPTREEWRKMSRDERRAYKEKVLSEKHASTKDILESKTWVLEADRLQDRNGETYIMQPSLNFVGVDQEHATLQLGSPQEVGYNGVGGITLDGKVLSYELNEGKRTNSGFYIVLSVQGAAMGSSTVLVNVSSDGNATATVTTLEGDRLTYLGTIVALDESRVYKGNTLF